MRAGHHTVTTIVKNINHSSKGTSVLRNSITFKKREVADARGDDSSVMAKAGPNLVKLMVRLRTSVNRPRLGKTMVWVNRSRGPTITRTTEEARRLASRLANIRPADKNDRDSE